MRFFDDPMIRKWGVTEAERQFRSGLVGGCSTHSVISHFQHKPGKYEELTPSNRKRSAGLAADEKGRSHTLFDLLDLTAQRGLSDADAFRRCSETAFFCHCHKRYKMTELGPFIHDCHDLSARRPVASWQSVVAIDTVRGKHRWLSILVRPKGGASNQMRPVKIWTCFCIAVAYDPIENEYWTAFSASPMLNGGIAIYR
jgi:hypothetical protein